MPDVAHDPVCGPLHARRLRFALGAGIEDQSGAMIAPSSNPAAFVELLARAVSEPGLRRGLPLFATTAFSA